MLMPEEELPVQVAEIYRVQVYNVDLFESGEDEVLEQLAADPTGAHEQDAGLYSRLAVVLRDCGGEAHRGLPPSSSHRSSRNSASRTCRGPSFVRYPKCQLMSIVVGNGDGGE